MTEHSQDLAILLIVMASRFVVPLAIPRFPLPAMIAAMLIDAADQTIFQTWTTLDLDWYQSYDKALDVYYLAIAYISSLRNWVNLDAFNTSKFLFYYRMVGVLLFEITHTRTLLLIFPNTFEYFFDFIEAVRLRWDPRKLSRKTILASAAFIWIFIKLPQEYWIHVAQLDTTEFAKEHIFGVDPNASWGDAISNRPLALVAILGVVAAVAYGIHWLLKNKVPDYDWKQGFEISVPPDVTPAQIAIAQKRGVSKFIDESLLEKVVLLSLIGAIFAHTLPSVHASDLEVAASCAIVVFLNSIISEWLQRRNGTGFDSLSREMTVIFAINLGLAAIAAWVLDRRGGDPSFGALFFYVLLFTVLISFFDRYRPMFEARWGEQGSITHALDSENAYKPAA